MTQILIAREKHGDSYYDASTPELLARASLTILKDRLREGWYYEPELETRSVDKNVQSFLDLTPEQVEALPDVVKEQAVAARAKYGRAYASELRRYKQEREWYDEVISLTNLPVEEAVAQVQKYPSGRTQPKAWLLLEARTDAEYEGVALESLSAATGE